MSKHFGHGKTLHSTVKGKESLMEIRKVYAFKFKQKVQALDDDETKRLWTSHKAWLIEQKPTHKTNLQKVCRLWMRKK
jgi:hypothetical protein